MELTKEQIRETIARRVAQELKEGDYVTLGIGLPTRSGKLYSRERSCDDSVGKRLDRCRKKAGSRQS